MEFDSKDDSKDSMTEGTTLINATVLSFFVVIARAILAICYRHAWKQLRSNPLFANSSRVTFTDCQIPLLANSMSYTTCVFQCLQISPCYVYCQTPLLANSAPPLHLLATPTMNKDFHIVAQRGSQTPQVDVNDVVAEKCDWQRLRWLAFYVASAFT